MLQLRVCGGLHNVVFGDQKNTATISISNISCNTNACVGIELFERNSRPMSVLSHGDLLVIFGYVTDTPIKHDLSLRHQFGDLERSGCHRGLRLRAAKPYRSTHRQERRRLLKVRCNERLLRQSRNAPEQLVVLKYLNLWLKFCNVLSLKVP